MNIDCYVNNLAPYNMGKRPTYAYIFLIETKKHLAIRMNDDKLK